MSSAPAATSISSASARLQNGGVYESLRRAGRLHSLAVTPDGDVLLGGVVNPPVNFGDGEQTTPFEYQPFLARVDDAGNAAWSTLFCSEKPVQVPVVAHDSGSAIAILHLNSSAIELGSTQVPLSGALYIEMPADH